MKRKGISLLVLLLLFLGRVQAFQFQPITMDFQDSGSESIKNFQCNNTTEETIALKVSFFKRSIDESGEEHLVPAEEDFLAYPARMVLESGQSQSLRVQYRGEALQGVEQAYRIFVEQVPVDFREENQGGLTILFRYIGSLYIVPEKLEEKVELLSVNKADSADGPGLAINIQNNGSTHIIMQNVQLKLSQENKEVLLGPDELSGINGINLLAGGSRYYLAQWPEELENGPIEGELIFEGMR